MELSTGGSEPDMMDSTGGVPSAPRAIDLFFLLPGEAAERRSLAPLLKDEESRMMESPGDYLFGRQSYGEGDPVEVALDEMNRWGVDRAMIDVGPTVCRRALKAHPTRFFGALDVDPNEITRTVRAIRAAHEEWGIKAVTSMPAACVPQVPISDRRYYPIFQACVDLDLPFVVNVGVPGPRVPSHCQHVEHLDDVCYEFPELTVVMRHGAEPWEELAVKLMIKYPNLYYCTSGFAPKFYPKAIVDYANTRGADRIMYGGYFPTIGLDRIMTELRSVPFRDHVWRPLLRDNALRVFRLDAELLQPAGDAHETDAGAHRSPTVCP